MGSTYYSLHYHWVCSTKERLPLILSAWRAQFHEYLGGTIRGLDGVALKIGGVEDHVHALLGLKTTHCLADFARELKKASSVWAAEKYERQEEHHRKVSFVDELKQLLEKHGIKYDPKYFL